MQLTQEIAEKALQKINQKCSPFKCPMCGSTGGFHFAPIEIQQLSLDRTGMSISLGGKFDLIPTVTGTCPNCGFIASFNLHTIGVL